MNLLTLTILAIFFIGASAEQYAWDGNNYRYFETEWTYETEGKPSKMLQTGRLPALGCKGIR
jgi:hypothetical protein